MEVFTPSLPALSLLEFRWPAPTLELYACPSIFRLLHSHPQSSIQCPIPCMPEEALTFWKFVVF